MKDTSSLNRFILLGGQRTGTTFLRGCLDSHPQIKCKNELFNLRRFENDCYTTFLKNNGGSRFGNLIFRHKHVEKFLENLYSEEGSTAIGFKFMYSDAKTLPYKFPMVIPYVKKNDIKVIHLKRSNLLKTLVSKISAAQSGVYHSVEIQKEKKKIHIPANTLLKRLKDLKREQIIWDKRLCKVDHITITYEIFCEQNEVISDKLSKFLGVDVGHPLRSSLKKLNPDDLRMIIKNYISVKSVLHGSEFEWCLEQ